MSIQSKVENYIRAVKELKKTVDELDEVYNDLHNNSTSSKYTTEFIALPEVSQAVLNRPVSVFFSEVFPNDALVLSGKDKLVHPRDSKPIEISSFDKNKMEASNNDTEKKSGFFPLKGFSMSGIYEKFKGINVGSELDKSNDNNKEDNTEKGEEDDEVSTSSESDEESEEGDDENDNEDKEVSTSGESGDKRDKIKKIVIPKDNIDTSDKSTHKRKNSSEVVTLENNADYSAFSDVDPNKQPKVITIEDDGDKSKKAKKTTKPPSKTLVTKGAGIFNIV